ncbi:MAG TPA: hypothetical protein DEF30_05900 [Proteiniclasticum sp.]|uniref:O-antigen polymerase n=1 Tax=Proteiniclasticum sp. TaxID=2053595 RepID=UPI000E89DBF8|nr:O-antigen polymerase [Proteiniclasticum sp.]HBW13334.1 hypothetical protein [Proteiniclasticum sp.]
MIELLIFLYILVSIAATIFTKLKLDNYIRLNTLFTYTWTIGGILNLTNFAGMYRAEYKIHGYIFITLIIFNIGYLLFSEKVEKRKNIKTLSLYFPKRILFLANLLVILFMLPFFVKAIRIISVHGFAYLRKFAFVASEEFTSLFEARIMVWIVAPIVFVSLIIVVIQIITGNFSMKLSVLVLVNVGLYTFTLGGKMLIVVAILLFVLMLLINQIYFEPIKKIKLNFIHLTILGVAVLYLVITTSKRALSGLGVIENFVVYNYGGISYFDAILKSNEYSASNSELLLGRGVFGIVLTPLIYIIRHTIRVPLYDSEYITKLITTYFLPISENYNFNSHPTALYIFWRDTNSVIGIIIGAIFLVMISIFVEKYFNKHHNVLSLSMLLFLFYAFFMTTQKFVLYEVQSAMNVFFMLLFTTRILEPIEIKLEKISR